MHMYMMDHSFVKRACDLGPVFSQAIALQTWPKGQYFDLLSFEIFLWLIMYYFVKLIAFHFQ